MKSIKLLLVALVALCANTSYGQFYRGIKEVKQYKTELARLDIYLQTSPDNLSELYENLYFKAKKSKNKTLETVLNIYKGTAYYYSGQSDSSIVYFDKAIANANKIKNNSLLSTARIRKIFVVGERTDTKIAYEMMRDEYNAAKKNKDTMNMIYSLNGMNLFGEQEEKDSGFDANVKAMKLAQESGNEYEYGFLLNNLGVTKLDLGDPEGAIKDFKEGLRIAKRVENPRLELTILENVGYYYMEVDSVEMAKKTFHDVYDRGKQIKHYQIAVTSIVNLSGVYRKQKDYVTSDSLTQEGLVMAKNNDMFYLVSLIYLSKAHIKLMSDEYDDVVRCLDSAVLYEKYTPNQDVRQGIYQTQYLMYKRKGDFEKALDYYQQLKQFQDSINKNGRLQMISELQLKYDVEKKEKERVQQQTAYEKKLAREELNNAVLKQRLAIGAILVILLLAGLVIYYFRSKQKRESEFSSAMVNRLEEERGRIARDLHDGIGQSLIVLKNKFNKIESGAKDLSEELNHNFSETIEEVRSISRSLIPPELRRFGLVKSLNRMLNDVESSAGIVVTIEIEDLENIPLTEPEEIRIYRIIQELANNTIKHSEATSLKLEVLDSGSNYTMIYQDNGKGLSLDRLNGATDSVGLRSIQQRVKFLKGSVKFERPPRGFKATFKLKKTK